MLCIIFDANKQQSTKCSIYQMMPCTGDREDLLLE